MNKQSPRFWEGREVLVEVPGAPLYLLPYVAGSPGSPVEAMVEVRRPTRGGKFSGIFFEAEVVLASPGSVLRRIVKRPPPAALEALRKAAQTAVDRKGVSEVMRE